MSESLIPDEARAYIGKTIHSRSALVSERDIRKNCLGTGDLNPIYLDEDAARAAGYRGIVCPPLYVSGVMRPLPTPDGLLEDGQFVDFAVPGLNHLRTMIGGGRTDVIAPVIVGDVVTETHRIADLYQKEGRSGPIVFQIGETDYTVNGQLVQRSQGRLTLRAFDYEAPVLGGAVAPRPAEPEPDELFEWRTTSMVDLFMYAASMWAVHRIHYDAEWARSEGFAGPVVIGGVSAAYVARLVTAGLGQAAELVHLDTRYSAVVCAGDRLLCAARITAREGRLADFTARVVRDDGLQTMTASGQVRFRE